jgi:hypothetical protein
MRPVPSIGEFWKWFEDHHPDIAEAYDMGAEDRLEELFEGRLPNTSVALNWELGPYHHPDYTLVLSPTVRENLPLTKRMVAEAPAIQGWKFYHAKPPKRLASLTFSSGVSTVVADDWRYIMALYPDGFMELDILIPAATKSRPAQDYLFCELLVEALLGEERRLLHIGRVTPIRQETTDIPRGIPIRSLPHHVDEELHRDKRSEQRGGGDSASLRAS